MSNNNNIAALKTSDNDNESISKSLKTAPKKKSKVGIAFGIIVSLIGATFGGYFLFRSKNEKNISTDLETHEMIASVQNSAENKVNEPCVLTIKDSHNPILEITFAASVSETFMTETEAKEFELAIVEAYNDASGGCSDEFKRWMYGINFIDQTVMKQAVMEDEVEASIAHIFENKYNSVIRLETLISCDGCVEGEAFASVYPTSFGRTSARKLGVGGVGGRGPLSTTQIFEGIAEADLELNLPQISHIDILTKMSSDSQVQHSSYYEEAASSTTTTAAASNGSSYYGSKGGKSSKGTANVAGAATAAAASFGSNGGKGGKGTANVAGAATAAAASFGSNGGKGGGKGTANVAGAATAAAASVGSKGEKSAKGTADVANAATEAAAAAGSKGAKGTKGARGTKGTKGAKVAGRDCSDTGKGKGQKGSNGGDGDCDPSPTIVPNSTAEPTRSPLENAIVVPATGQPTRFVYTPQPTNPPTYPPTPLPSPRPTPDPTPLPTLAPVENTIVAPPTDQPTRFVYTPQPTKPPTNQPTPLPTPNPTPEPTPRPTPRPTPLPTFPPFEEAKTQPPTPEPTPNPTPEPTPEPTPNPTPLPTPSPSASPTQFPTCADDPCQLYFSSNTPSSCDPIVATIVEVDSWCGVRWDPWCVVTYSKCFALTECDATAIADIASEGNVDLSRIDCPSNIADAVTIAPLPVAQIAEGATENPTCPDSFPGTGASCERTNLQCQYYYGDIEWLCNCGANPIEFVCRPKNE